MHLADMPAEARMFYDERTSRMGAGRVRARLKAKKAMKAELLVDGDQRGIEATKEAVEQLQTEGWTVKTTVYAAPGRSDNKKWKSFFSQSNLSYKAIPRSKRVEAVDVAIADRLLHLAKREGICPALLTSDIDYVEAIQAIVKMGRQILVLVPQGAKSSIREFEMAGARVLPLLDREWSKRGPKIRAILHAHGGGSVKTAEPWVGSPVDPSDYEELDVFLKSQKYRADRGHLAPSIAKFWFMHRLGDLTVFPVQCGCAATLQFVRKANSEAPWKLYNNNLAYFLPIASQSRKSAKILSEYGGMTARRIFCGGGPFVINDSPDMVEQALSMMGYLDYKLNADVAEAMLTFVNIPENKLNLRKYCDALPSPDDSASSVLAKLRRAFLSHATRGQWRLAPKDTEVRKELVKQGLLQDPTVSRSLVLGAMRKLARRYNLPEMRSYNGYLFRLLHHMYNSDPSRTGTVEFKV